HEFMRELRAQQGLMVPDVAIEIASEGIILKGGCGRQYVANARGSGINNSRLPYKRQYDLEFVFAGSDEDRIASTEIVQRLSCKHCHHGLTQRELSVIPSVSQGISSLGRSSVSFI